ncbi:MAG: hypothetical protein Q8L27_00185, partial [archaeon]|nr:hypothetical protein [archaeon]
MKTNFKQKRVSKKLVAESFFEIFTMILSTFAFAFIIGGMAIGVSETIEAVEITSPVPTGCCKEAKDGSICQTMNKLDEIMCKDSLIATSCNQVSGCEIGCCYSSGDGSCSLNSPKQKCEQNNGLWNNQANCNIAQCQLGCCILGEGASITTTRECSLLSDELKLETNFQNLDSDGTCRSKTGLSEKGACITPSKDFSDKNDCRYTTRDSCKTGDFFGGELCSNPELKTVCEKTDKTMCSEDSLYYLDTCGNPDEKKDDCDYTQGFMCQEAKTKGNAFCKDLNCANGKKHGESWCVSDYSNTDVFGVSPIGSRWFKAKCIEGDITIEPCADFNQETCISNIGTGEANSEYSEARCVVNNWRNCIAANDKDTYSEVQKECSKYPDDCVMFLDIPGNEKYTNLPGFIKGDDIVDKATPLGNAGKVGEDENKKIANCVPKNTPGMVFWQTNVAEKFTIPGQTESTGTTTQTQKQSFGGLDYGGSYEETKAICSLGSFTCVSHQEFKFPNRQSNFGVFVSSGLSLTAPDTDWEDKQNPECNINAAQTQYSDKVPLTIEALNERCKMLGPCGVNVNVIGELGDIPVDDSFTRVEINAKGKESKSPLDAYKLSENYLSNLKNAVGVKTMGSITKLTGLVIDGLITGKDIAPTADVNQQAKELAKKTEGQTAQTGGYIQTAGSLSNMGLSTLSGSGSGATGTTLPAGATAYTATTNSVVEVTTKGTTQTYTVLAGNTEGFATESSVKLVSGSGNALGSGANPTPVTANSVSGLSYSAITIAGAIAGYFIGTWIAKSSGMTPGQTQSFVGAMTAAGTAAAVGILILVKGVSGCAGGPATCIVTLVIAAIYFVYSLYFTGKDHRYYILQYNCEPWQPPIQGDCSVCNKDIRTCSENRCKSLGQNCEYYDDTGEPGTCASVSETWSAKITPWQEALTEGNKYVEVKDRSFSIQGTEEDGKVEAWKQLQFGITTDKPAVCKIDTKHTKTFDEMATTMEIDVSGCVTDSCSVSQGVNHKIVLSQHMGTLENSGSTIGMVEGDNNYYI